MDLKLQKEVIFFTQWVTKLWKALLRDVVDGRGLNGFVEDLDKPVEAWSVKGCSTQTESRVQKVPGSIVCWGP